ncbi:uncharacterized protein LOC132386420 [Hypanus sabinus]|uniref:uncharacterized protein LOC132386420 n=1 Tax=Hypanus sabinus TaxID=79690 RepID=UPI0028C4722E|nr:uncharacterized protein LOC132386420 [Hypanus sabinus]
MLLLLVLAQLLQRATSQSVRQDTPALSKSPDESVELECILDGGSTSNYLYWYRQYPGKEIQNLFHSTYTDIVIPEGAVDGFTARRPVAETFILSSASVRPDQSAVYYCAWSPHSGSETRRCPTKTFAGGRKQVVCMSLLFDSVTFSSSYSAPCWSPGDQSANLKGRSGGSLSDPESGLLSMEYGCTEKDPGERMLLLLVLAPLLQRVTSQSVRQDTPALSKSPGESVELKCILDGGSASNYLYWYKQYPGKEIQYLFHSTYTEIVNPEGAVDGFTARRPFVETFILSSASVRPEQSAVYFCAWSPHSGSETRRGPTKTFAGGRKQLICETH